jgi:hypothetical protein
MQNKAKFQKVKFNVTKVLTKDYNQTDTWSIRTKQSQTNPNKPNFKPKNDTGSDFWCYKSTVAFTKNNVNRNCFLVKPLYQVRKSRLIQRVDFLQHGLLTHIRVVFGIVETKLKVYI